MDPNDYLTSGVVNQGPNGAGSYDNDDNALENGGTVRPTEAKSMTGEFMASMDQPSRPSLPSGSRSADEAEMRGGNV